MGSFLSRVSCSDPYLPINQLVVVCTPSFKDSIYSRLAYGRIFEAHFYTDELLEEREISPERLSQLRTQSPIMATRRCRCQGRVDRTPRRCLSPLSFVFLFLCFSLFPLRCVNCFQSRSGVSLSQRAAFPMVPAAMSQVVQLQPRSNHWSYTPCSRVTRTSLNMFMGSDGGLLGVGGPELVRGRGVRNRSTAIGRPTP
jgi:hypothetical protein